MTPDDILPTYQKVAKGFARDRDRSLFERRWLDRALSYAPGRKVLDLGCGPGLPIAAYLQDRRCDVTGVDGAPAMVALFEGNLPQARAIEADMRGLALGESFDLILAWNSLFHLSAEDQTAMFKTFAAHSHPRTVLMFTSGTSEGEAMGHVAGETVYHASLSPRDYRACFEENGFDELAFKPEDPECNNHSIWMARRRRAQ
ncbi:MAG: class I SAM-dependent methyltransferase [Maritimibacter sp.]